MKPNPRDELPAGITPEDVLLKPTQAAEMLGVTPKTLENWRGRKEDVKLRYVRFSHRCVRYKLSDVRDLIKNQTIG